VVINGKNMGIGFKTSSETSAIKRTFSRMNAPVFSHLYGSAVIEEYSLTGGAARGFIYLIKKIGER
jgi:hypothetical protein